MKKTLIGITSQYNESTGNISMVPSYLNAVAALGAVPILLYCTPDDAVLQAWTQLCDGLLIMGGPDIDPACYGQPRHEKCGNICPSRDRTESRLFRLFREAGKPVFGICRGAQLVNALLGGTLYQDLPSQFSDTIPHRLPEPDVAWHSMEILPETRTRQLLGVAECTVNSYHHQGFLKLAEGMRPAAVAPDGLVEAFESVEGPWTLCVQWHPEKNFFEDPLSRKLFQGFLDACQNNTTL